MRLRFGSRVRVWSAKDEPFAGPRIEGAKAVVTDPHVAPDGRVVVLLHPGAFFGPNTSARIHTRALTMGWKKGRAKT